MSTPRCHRAWQAEASLDRRISAEDRASFSRHARTCAECAKSLLELSRLQELGERLPWPRVEPLQRKRQRNELLRRAHGLGFAAPTTRRRYAALLPICCAVLLLLVGYRRLVQPRPEASAPALTYQVQADAGSDWRRLQGGHAVRLELEFGRLTVHVDKLQPRQSFVLRLPDGELEVRGTRFVVEAVNGATKTVAVSEGLVALRVRGRPELLLGVGASWQAEPAAAPAASSAPVPADSAHSAPPPAVTPPPRTTSARPPGAATPAPAAAPAAAPVATPAAAAVAAPVAAPSTGSATPNHDFADAMSAFARGDFDTAEQAFERFERTHPRSSQVEDALFLRALSRFRRGDAAGAQRLASDYLRRYPGGFHAAEAERLATKP